MIEQKRYNFTVIVPCFNMGNTLSETIDSILNQTLRDIQILVIDDASTDDFTKKELSKYNDIVDIVWLEKNGGLSHARNTGIKLAKSEYVLCLDSDDKIEKTYLEKAKIIFDNDKSVGLVSSGMQHFGASHIKMMPSIDFTLMQLMTVNRIPVASCVRKKVYDDIGIYDENLSVYEDWDLWIRLFASNRKWEMMIIPEYLFFYRVRKNSMMHSLDEEKMTNSLRHIINKHKSYYERNHEDIFIELHNELMRARVHNQLRHLNQRKITFSLLAKYKKKIFPKKWF